MKMALLPKQPQNLSLFYPSLVSFASTAGLPGCVSTETWASRAAGLLEPLPFPYAAPCSKSSPLFKCLAAHMEPFSSRHFCWK